MRVLVTGAAGFVGFHTTQRLLNAGADVIGLDNFNSYYETRLKDLRIAQFEGRKNFQLVRMDIADAPAVEKLIQDHAPTHIVHLAAQAGVRYSIDNPFSYERSNLAGHLSILEGARRARALTHLIYASSSSVYGDRPRDNLGFSEDDPAIEPVSLYAATKRACELMSYSYAKLYDIPQTGLRFFTVYGPWGRPDMAYYSFTKKILAGETLDVYGNGEMARDFTYVDDIVDGIVSLLNIPPEGYRHRVLNIGDSVPVPLLEMIGTLEAALGQQAKKRFLPMQPGDVTRTYADITRIKEIAGYTPQVPLSKGIAQFVDWYTQYHDQYGALR